MPPAQRFLWRIRQLPRAGSAQAPRGPSASSSCASQTETEQLCGSPHKAPESSRGTFSQRKAVGLKGAQAGGGRGPVSFVFGMPPCIEWGWSGCPQGSLLTLGFGGLISLGSVGGPECFPEGDHGGGGGCWNMGFQGCPESSARKERAYPLSPPGGKKPDKLRGGGEFQERRRALS